MDGSRSELNLPLLSRLKSAAFPRHAETWHPALARRKRVRAWRQKKFPRVSMRKRCATGFRAPHAFENSAVRQQQLHATESLPFFSSPRSTQCVKGPAPSPPTKYPTEFIQLNCQTVFFIVSCLATSMYVEMFASRTHGCLAKCTREPSTIGRHGTSRH